MKNWGRTLLIWLLAGLVFAGLFQMLYNTQTAQHGKKLAYSDLMTQVEDGKVSEVIIQGDQLLVSMTDGTKASTFLLPDPALISDLRAHKVKVSGEPEEHPGFFSNLLFSILPVLLLIGFYVYMMKQGQGGRGGAFGFGRSKAKLLSENKNKVTFEDVAGIDEAKYELQEIVEFLKDPPKFQRLGGKIPKGVLLVGSPGTGKTLLARAVAGEAGVPFFSISGSDFVEMFVGVGASRVRDMFEQGKKNAPCLIFIDEIDAVGRHRGVGIGGGNDEREQTLNQMLVEMDGFEGNEGVIIIAATNRPDVLDPALLRPGRFDRKVIIDNPDIGGREKILKVHMRKTPLADNVDPRTIARGTPGFSGADLANLVNEAALLAARRNLKVVSMAEFEDAKDKVMMGTERRSMVMSDKEKKLTAYHEAGHAVIAYHEPESDPIHKATIIPRGFALGMVVRLPEGDRLSYSFAKFKADLAVAFGGRVAEEMIFGHDKVTSGASSDIQQATKIARKMVTEYGMSDKLGFIDYSNRKYVSGATGKMIDEEVQRIIDEAQLKARQVLMQYKDELDFLANALLEYETLTGDEVKQVLAGKKLDRSERAIDPAKAKKPATSRRGSLKGVLNDILDQDIVVQES